MALAPGTRLGVYEITVAIGAGGMGEVYRARDTRLKREVALKLLPPSVAADHDRLARFQREAEILASLNHPNIAAIYGLEESQAERAAPAFIVMELVEGEDLAVRIARGRLPLAEALPLSRQIADALETAHARGIIHRDLKPANVKVRPDGVLKLLDFGLAKGSEGARTAGDVTNSPTITSPAMTTAGMILGTAAYMSPEQARGKPVDKQADIWAFGALLYEMLTGHRAFPGDDVSETLASVLAREPDWSRLPADVPPTLTLFLKRCLERDPKRRLRDMGDMLLALDGGLDVAEPAAAAPSATVVALWRRLLPIAATAVVAFIIGAIAMRRDREAPASEPVTRFEIVAPPGQQVSVIGGRPIVALSADGRTVAYKAADGVYVRTLSDFEPRLLPGTGETLSTPFFSPDGQWLGWYTPTELKKIPIAGGEAVRLASVQFPSGASWPKPDTILFAAAAGILRLSANGGTPEVLIRAAEGEQMYAPQLLPDGSVLFALATGSGLDRWEKAQVVVQSPASEKRTVVAANATEARYLADGFITYTSGRRLFAVRFDLARMSVVGAVAPIVDNVQIPVGLASMLSTGANYDVSRSGSLIYMPNDVPERTLTWVNRDGTTAGVVANIPPGAYEDPRLSPDGKRLLVTRDGDIWVYEIDSGRESRVTRNRSSLMGVWNPSGREIAHSAMVDGALEAFVVPVDGSGEPRQVTRDKSVVHVDSWSPDGGTLSVHTHGLTQSISMVALDPPGQERSFADREAQPEGADFAHDSRHVVYLSTDNGRREIYIRPYPGPGGRVTVSVDGGREGRWAANGEVFYRSPDGTRMFVVQTTTSPTLSVSKPTLLFQGNYYIALSNSPRPQYDVTADGQRFLMLVPTSSTRGAGARPRILVVRHWVDELKRLLPAP